MSIFTICEEEDGILSDEEESKIEEELFNGLYE